MRATASIALVAMLTGPLRMAYAAAMPEAPAKAAAQVPQGPPGPSSPGPAGKLATDAPWALPSAVRPARIKIISGAADEAAVWRLFDGRGATGLSVGGQGARFRLELPRPTHLDAVAIFGPATGALGVEAEGPDGTKIDLLPSTSISGGGGGWSRHSFMDGPLATAVVVTLQPGRGGDATLPELELWGRPASAPAAAGTPTYPDALYAGVPAGAREARAPQGEQTISPATVSGPGVGGVFTVDVDTDPAGVDRAFLVYELSGLPHFTAAARSLNGARVLGRFGVSRGAKGGLQVEEISPASLVRGRNRIQFFPAEESNPESYRVSELRVVVVPRAETAVTDAAARDFGALHDGREGTGWRAAGAKAGDTRRWEFATATQPWDLDFRLPARGAGTLTIASANKRDKGQITVKLDGLAAGWHHVPLEKMPETDALTMTLAGGKEESAAISEMTIEGSPLPADEAPRIAVTYPLSGECVNHRVHVRGFVTPEGAEAIYAGGKRLDGVLSRDGAFAFELPEKDAAGRDLALEAVYPGGARVRRAVGVGRCIERAPVGVADDGRPRQPKDDVGAPYGVTVRAGQAASLSFAGMKLEIPAGAIEKDVRLTVRPLPTKHVAPLDPGMTNVSPEAQAFRLGPHGMVFKKPVRVSLPYTKQLIPAGYASSDVRTFYYDEDLHRWDQVGLIAQNDGEMVSVTEHFTDFINATIAMPEHPGTQSINPTSLKDMKMADPAAGVSLIEPPTANSRGTANLRLPIEVPPGRRGIQPELAIGYDSDKQNGWLGVGWDLQISSIQIDTRFGVPKYDGSETYLLDGEMLAPATTNPPGAPPGPKYFLRRAEGKFDWIARSGSAASGFTWLLTTKDGVQLSYGAATNSRLSDPQDATKTFRWSLDRVTDPLKNQMTIAYQIDTGNASFGGAVPGNNEPFVQMYPSQIVYTGHPNIGPAYSVTFKVGGPDGQNICNRPDPLIDGRAGFQVLTRCVLNSIDVNFQSQLVRRYALAYDSPINQGVSGRLFEPGHFGKSLLSRIDVIGTNGTDVFYSHTFDYFAAAETLPANSGDRGGLSLLSDPVTWAPISNLDFTPRNQEGLTHTVSSTFSTGTEADIGIMDASAGVGASFCLSAKDESPWQILDSSGDSLPDGVSQDGLLDLSSLVGTTDRTTRRTPGAFRGLFSPIGTDDFAGQPLSHTDRDLFSVNHHLFVLSNSLDLTNRARETRTLLDINGDGYPDQLVATSDGMSVRLNNRNLGFLPSQPWANYTLSSNSCDDPIHHALASGASTFLSALNKLVAPVTGLFETAGELQFFAPETPGSVEALIIQNSQTIWRHTITGADPPCVPGPGNSCSGGLTLNVQAGDRIYTQLRALDNPNIAIRWSPQFTYTSVNGQAVAPTNANLFEPYGAPIYRFDQSTDFKFLGHSLVEWAASASGSVNIAGNVDKQQPTSDDLRVRVVRRHTDPSNPNQTTATVLSETPLGAMTTGSTPVTLGSVPVTAGDTLSFEVLSDLPIDPTRVSWQPIVRYSSFCATDPTTGISACSDVTCPPDGTTGFQKCSLVQSPIPGLKVPSSTLQTQVNPFFPLFEFQPGTVTQTFVAQTAGPVNLAGTVTKTAPTSSPVVVAVQGVNALYKKYVFQPGETGPISFDMTTPSLAVGGQLFFTVYSDSDASGAIAWSPSIDGAAQPVTFRSRAAGTVLDPSGVGVIETMAGGYHGWSFGLWDGAVAFDETKIALGTTTPSSFFPMFASPQPVAPTSSGDPVVEFCNPFTSLSCAIAVGTVVTAGPAIIPAVLPVATDPNVILTAATGHGIYVLTQLGGCGGPFAWIDCKSLPAIRLTSSTNFDTSLKFPLLPQVSINGGVNVGDATSRIDLIDMNGDRYPDAVVKDGVLFNTGAAFEPAITNAMALPLGDIRHSDHFNLHVGAAAGGTQNFTDAEGNDSGYNISGGLGLGVTYGQSITSTDLIDINGDGLPDHIAGDQSTGHISVRLNLGHRFANPIDWPGSKWSERPGSLDDLLKQFGSLLGPDAIRIEDTSANNESVNAGGGGPISNGIGGGVNVDYGVSHTMIRKLVDFVDINGDGLPDQIMKAPGRPYIAVKLNLGGGFDAEKRIPVTKWDSVGAPDGKPGGIFDLALGSADDSVGYSVASGNALTGGGNISFPCAGPVPCTFSGSFTKANGDSNDTMAFEDIDGDGRPDEVVKADGNAQVFARLNVTGKTNLLHRVTRPLGAFFELEYERTGNKISSELKVDMPGNQWALAEVTVDDGRTNEYTDTFHYGVRVDGPGVPSGFHDRTERENYGYAHVVTIHGRPNGSGGIENGDGSIVERFYENQDFYRKGLLKGEFEEDHAGKIFRGSLVRYQDPSTASLPARTGIFFPAESDRYTLFYEGASSNAALEVSTLGAGALKSKHERRTFDASGNLVSLVDFGDEQTAADDITYAIVTTDEAGTHITRATSIEADASATAQMLRKRTAVYAPSLGTLTKLTSIVSGGKVPGSGATGTVYDQASAIYSFVYDAFGNLQSFTDPTGFNLQYTYDQIAQMYRTRIDDKTFGLFSTASFDLRFGNILSSTDTNGQKQSFAIDGFGRLLTVRGPDDQTASEPTIAMAYDLTVQPAVATTSHKDVQHPGDPIQTISFIDGLRRVIQTKKDVDIDANGSGTVVTRRVVSGRVTFDARGRIASQDQATIDNVAANFLKITGPAQPNPTLYAYDELGRATNITVPDATPQGIQTNTIYRIVKGQDNDNLGDDRTWLVTEVRDGNAPVPQPNTPPPTTVSGVGRRLSYADGRGNQIATREFNQVGSSTTLTTLTTKYVYDPIDQLLSVTDAKGNVTSSVYDTLGQMVTLVSKDSGRTEYRFDLNGNLQEKQTAIERAAGQTTKYLYDHNRVTQVNFPNSADVTYTYGGPTETGNTAGNLAGRIKKVAYDNGSELRFYDGMGNVREARTTLNRMSTTTGLPPSITFTMKYTYDWLGRMQTMTFPNWLDQNYNFIAGDGELVSYFYDHGGNVDRVTGHHQTKNPQQTSHPIDFKYLNHIGYNEFDQRTVVTDGNGIANKYLYDGATRRLTDIQADSRGSQEVALNIPATPFHRLHYVYDKVGNVVHMTNNVSVRPYLNAGVFVGPLDITYSYDNLYELRGMSGKYRPHVAYGYQYSDTYTYDEIGNIKSKAQSQDRLVWDNQTVNQTDKDPVTTLLAGSRFDHNVAGLTYALSYTYPSTRPHGATPVSETPAGSTASNRTYTYDANGNNTGNSFKADTRQQVWDDDNRLAQVTRNGGSLAQFRYDDQGERRKKLTAAGDTWYVNQYYQLGPNTTPTKHIFAGETRISTKSDAIWMQTPTLNYYHPDHLGTTSYTSVLSQNLVQHERYFAYGELWRPGGEQEETDLSRPDGARREWLFTSKEWDVDTNLYYFGARYFDPHADVWQSTDPILSSYMRRGPGGVSPKNLGLYTYGWNNPVVVRDADGRQSYADAAQQDIRNFQSEAQAAQGVTADPKRYSLGMPALEYYPDPDFHTTLAKRRNYETSTADSSWQVPARAELGEYQTTYIATAANFIAQAPLMMLGGGGGAVVGEDLVGIAGASERVLTLFHGTTPSAAARIAGGGFREATDAVFFGEEVATARFFGEVAAASRGTTGAYTVLRFDIPARMSGLFERGVIGAFRNIKFADIPGSSGMEAIMVSRNIAAFNAALKNGTIAVTRLRFSVGM